jgi:membrane protease YdiL (CAAX protease family)
LAIRLRKSAVILGLPLLLLAVDWLGSGRDAAALGLAIPPTASGLIGLAFAALVATAVLISFGFDWPKSSPENRAQALVRLKKAGLAPQSGTELSYAVLQAVLIGCGTEILFRGFLIWAFVPLSGLWGGVVVSALAYGLGHGDTDWRRLLGATISAFVFATAYGLTLSLWWLMAIHTFFGLQAAWIGYRSLAVTTPTP